MSFSQQASHTWSRQPDLRQIQQYAMSLQPYDDLPGIDEEGFATYDQFRTDMQHMSVTPNQWCVLDPALQQNPYVQEYDYNSMQPAKHHLQDMRDQLIELEHCANGHAYPTPLQIPDQYTFSRFDVHTPTSWTQQYRHVRYVSPSGHLGGSLSSTDSSPSERALSPDVARSYARPVMHPQLGGNTFSSQATDLSYIGNNATWSQQSMYIGGLASPCPSTQSSTACNLKDLQIRPDAAVEEEHFADEDTIHVKLNVPEDVVLSPEGSSRSLEDGGEDEMEAETGRSDDDAEYVPGSRGGKKQPGYARRSSTRGPSKSQAAFKTSMTTSGVVDTKARVNKNTGRKNSSGRWTKAHTLTGSGNGAAKNFRCTFSHYGCPAVFTNKNEWKRHVNSQHLKLGFWRCDVGSCVVDVADSGVGGRGHNDFNRKDLFTEHHRRMHAPWGKNSPTKAQKEEFNLELEAVRDRCWVVSRSPPSRSGCGFCPRVFDDNSSGKGNGKWRGKDKGSCSWGERMEHVGKHFEMGDIEEDREDVELTQWAIKEGVVRDYGKAGVWLVGLEPRGVQEDDEEAAVMRRRSGRRAARGEAMDEEEQDEEQMSGIEADEDDDGDDDQDEDDDDEDDEEEEDDDDDALGEDE